MQKWNVQKWNVHTLVKRIEKEGKKNWFWSRAVQATILIFLSQLHKTYRDGSNCHHHQNSIQLTFLANYNYKLLQHHTLVYSSQVSYRKIQVRCLTLRPLLSPPSESWAQTLPDLPPPLLQSSSHPATVFRSSDCRDGQFSLRYSKPSERITAAKHSHGRCMLQWINELNQNSDADRLQTPMPRFYLVVWPHTPKRSQIPSVANYVHEK